MTLVRSHFVLAHHASDFQVSPFPQIVPALDDATSFGIVDRRSRLLLAKALAEHWKANTHEHRLTIIVAPKAPPRDTRRTDAPVVSLIATAGLFGLVDVRRLPASAWCFEFLKRALRGPALEIDIQIVHTLAPTITSASEGNCLTTISHRGPERYLRLSVESIRRQSHATDVWVAIDQKYPCCRLLADAKDDARLRIYQMLPHPAGPFVALQAFSRASDTDFIARQDSDDFALPNRLGRLIGTARASDAGLVGSHELQLNEVTRQVLPVRYPLDVNRALDEFGPAYQALLPTTVVSRQAFEQVGGISTTRIFTLDVEFWLNASMRTRIVNVDEFLYIRRRHARSLTMRADIGMASLIRRRYHRLRTSDFRKVKAGLLDLEQSSLAIRHRTEPVDFLNLKTGISRRVILDEVGPATLP